MLPIAIKLRRINTILGAAEVYIRVHTSISR
jgi:hypothetical protein